MVVALSDVGKEPAPLVWSSARYMALVESGVIEEGRGVELIEGQVVATMPQGKLHYLVCLALQRVLVAMGAMGRGLSIQPIVNIAEGETYDPEFVLLRPEYAAQDLPTAADVLWVVEVSVSSRRIDLGPKRDAYARAGIPDYWVVDAVDRGVRAFSDPADGAYRAERFVPADAALDVPVLGASLDLKTIFPTAP